MTPPAKSASRFLPRFCLVLYVLATSIGALAGGLWAAFGIGGSLILYAATAIDRRKMPRPDSALSCLTAGALLLVFVTSFYSVSPATSPRLLVQEATIMIPLSLLFSPDMRIDFGDLEFIRWVALSAIIGALALGAEYVLGDPLLHAVLGAGASVAKYNRGISYLAMLAFPLAGALWHQRKRRLLAAFVMSLTLAVCLTESRATKLACMIGLATTFISCFYARHVIQALVVLMFALLTWPWAVTALFRDHRSWFEQLPPSWQHRVEIWDYVSYRIFDRPFSGWGMGSSHLLPFQDPHGASYQFVTRNAGHPHNALLQLWVELGMPGVILGLSFAFYVLHRIDHMPKSIRPFALGSWTAALSISLVAYNVWDDAFFAAFALTCFMFALLCRTSPEPQQTPNADLRRA